MAKVITVTNNKGGCGKTTTAINTGAALRLKGYDVLLIDFDGQANLTMSLRATGTTGNTYAVMKDSRTQYVQPVRVLSAEGPGAGELDVLPAVRDLSALDIELANAKDMYIRFRNVVAQYMDKYDYIIIDTPPSVGVLTKNALYSSNAAIVTVQPEYLAVQGLVSIQQVINEVGANLSAGLPFCVLFTSYDRRKGLHRMAVEQVEASGLPTFKTRIRPNVALGEAPACGMDIFRYSATSNGAADYKALADEVNAWCKIKHVKHR